LNGDSFKEGHKANRRVLGQNTRILPLQPVILANFLINIVLDAQFSLATNTTNWKPNTAPETNIDNIY